MRFIFIDEIEQQQKDPNFFGLGAVIIDSHSYCKFKKGFFLEFAKMNWDRREEFKGRYLFSQKGDKNVSIEKRINFVQEIAKVSKSKINARFTFLFVHNLDGSTESNYLLLLQKLIKQIKPTKKGGEANLVAVCIDGNQKINSIKIFDLVRNSLNKKMTILERPFLVDSDNLTCGVLTVDILSYLKSWVVLSKDEGESQMTLFESVQNINKQKLQTVKEIIKNVKNIREIK